MNVIFFYAAFLKPFSFVRRSVISYLAFLTSIKIIKSLILNFLGQLARSHTHVFITLLLIVKMIFRNVKILFFYVFIRLSICILSLFIHDHRLTFIFTVVYLFCRLLVIYYFTWHFL